MSWVKSGDNWMWATWVGDAQVVYLARYDGSGWIVDKKVDGSPCYQIGWDADLKVAQRFAEQDAERPL